MQQQHLPKHKWYSLRQGVEHRRYKIAGCALLTILLIAIISGIVFILLFVPTAIQKAFAGYGQQASYPPTYFKEFYSDGMLLHMEYDFDFSNYIWTEIRLEQPFSFRDLGDSDHTNLLGEDGKEGLLVATMPFEAVVAFGPSQKFVLNNDLTVHLNNVTHWTELWKQWLGHSRYKKAQREGTVNSSDPSPNLVQQNTWWLIESKVNIRMGPFYWSNIPIAKRMIWNGGLDYDGKYAETKVVGTSVSSLLNTPKVRLDLQYNSYSVVGFNFSTFAFSVYSIYQVNETYSTPVRLMDSQWNDFNYTSGVHNLTAENYVNFGVVPKARSALWQLGENVVKNKTSILVLKNMRTYGRQNLTQYELVSTAENYANGSIWVNEVLQSISFVVELNRELSLFKTFTKLFRKNKENIMDTTINQVTQWSHNNETKSQQSGFDRASSGLFLGLDELRYSGNFSVPDIKALTELYFKQN